MARRCPICKKEVVFEGNPFRPFCSDRCKLIDLDNWLSERYRIRVVGEEAADAVETLPADEDAKGNRE
jgi:endogenous inhibitor of DNA gyrase (YacG/DUF329 family)